MELKSQEAKKKSMANPEAQGFLKKLVENAWSKAGLEPNQPTKTHDDMMKIVDYF